MKYRVNVYQVAMRGDVNVEANSSDEACDKAIEMAKRGEVSLRFPDCQVVAVIITDPATTTED